MKRGKDNQPELFTSTPFGFTPKGGEALRDAGVARVLAHNEEWKDKACRAAIDFVARQPGEFTGEDIRAHCQALVGDPHHPNAWGGLIISLIRRRVIQATGDYSQAINTDAHARIIRVYTSRA